jgi:DNA-binding NtrC family response regulator
MCSKIKRHVLIIDDEKRFATMLSKRLSLRGYACDVAYDGEEGLAMLDHSTFKVVLLDLRLPGMSGEDVLKCVKMKHPDLPVIILTGHGNQKEREVCMGLKAHSFLNKPVDLSFLVELFETIIGPESGQQAESVVES